MYAESENSRKQVATPLILFKITFKMTAKLDLCDFLNLKNVNMYFILLENIDILTYRTTKSDDLDL